MPASHPREAVHPADRPATPQEAEAARLAREWVEALLNRGERASGGMPPSGEGEAKAGEGKASGKRQEGHQ